MGVRERRPRTASPSRRPSHRQRHHVHAQRRLRRIGLGAHTGGHGAALSRRRPARTRPRGLVRTLFGLSPLLRKPAAVLAGLRAAGRSPALSKLISGSVPDLQSTLMPAAVTTRFHFARSALISAANWSGPPAFTSPPCRRSASSTSGCFSAAAGGAVVDGARLRFRERNELLHVLHA